MEGLQGRYLYGVAASGLANRLGPIGIDGAEVYTVPNGSLCAIVHDCRLEPYQSADEATVKQWVVTHEAVLDQAARTFGTVIPLGFDTILRPGDTSADQTVLEWLRKDYPRLKALMSRIAGKDEYGVQVFFDHGVMSHIVAAQRPELLELKARAATRSAGVAYLYRQKLDQATREALDHLAEGWSKDILECIKAHCEETVIEKNSRPAGGRTMLLNLSCLASEQAVGRLGDELERINEMPGFSVRFTGPWLPYSFVREVCGLGESR